MKTQICLLSILTCTFGFAAEEAEKPFDRNTDMRCILEKSFLSQNAEPLLNMLALEAIEESHKTIDSEDLMQKLRDSLDEEATMNRFSEPYAAVFSDDELHELRNIFEMPVYEKYSQQGAHLFQSTLQALKVSFSEMAEKFGVEESGEDIAANANIIELTRENFKEQVEQSQKPIIVDFYADWCQPCHMLEPIMKKLSAEYGDSVQFAKINFDEQVELAKKFNIMQLPTILFIEPGQENAAMRSTGFLAQKQLAAKIDEFLALLPMPEESAEEVEKAAE